MGIAHAAFMTDNQGRMIPAANIRQYRENGPTVPLHFWFNALEPYMDSDAPPSRNTYGLNRPRWQRCPSKRMAITQDQRIGYGWNFHNFGHSTWGEVGEGLPNSGPNRYRFPTIHSVTRPARTILIGCSTDDEEQPGYVHMYLYMNTPGQVQLGRIWASRHNGTANYLHVDGHVSAYTPHYLEQNRHLFRRDQ